MLLSKNILNLAKYLDFYLLIFIFQFKQLRSALFSTNVLNWSEDILNKFSKIRKKSLCN